jgi:hypothetical protein
MDHSIPGNIHIVVEVDEFVAPHRRIQSERRAGQQDADERFLPMPAKLLHKVIHTGHLCR